jgi:hypothetical protein
MKRTIPEKATVWMRFSLSTGPLAGRMKIHVYALKN